MAPTAAIPSEELPYRETQSNHHTMLSWSFESASRKLLEGVSQPPFPLADLPTRVEDPLWEALRAEYRLSLAELSSLKNHVSGQQQEQVPLAYQPALEFAKKQMEEHTEKKSFSTAGYTFARLLLSERGVFVRTKAVNLENGDGPEPPSFDWTVITNDKNSVRPGEHYKNQQAKEWFIQNFLTPDSVYGLKVVTGNALPELRGYTKKAAGRVIS